MLMSYIYIYIHIFTIYSYNIYIYTHMHEWHEYVYVNMAINIGLLPPFTFLSQRPQNLLVDASRGHLLKLCLLATMIRWKSMGPTKLVGRESSQQQKNSDLLWFIKNHEWNILNMFMLFFSTFFRVSSKKQGFFCSPISWDFMGRPMLQLTGAFYAGNGWVAGGCWDDYW